MRRRLLRYSLTVFCVLITVDFIVCRIVDARPLPPDPPGLMRLSTETSTKWTLSYLTKQNSDAQRIIYVHGTPGDALAFANYLVSPIEGFEALSVDRPGFGHTNPHKPAHSLRDQAAVFEPLLVERDGKWPILVGHSMGAPVISRVAADFPDRVGGLVILAGALDPELETVYWIQRIGALPIVRYLIPRGLRNVNGELIPLRQELQKLKPLLKTVRCPVVIVHARNDMLVPFGNVDYMKNSFLDTVIKDIIVLEGKNHFIPWNSEATIRRAIVKTADYGVGDQLPIGN